MRCDEIREQLPLHSLDLLEPAEAEEVRRHLASGCPACAAEMAALRESVAGIPYALPAEEPSPMAKARLLAAVRGPARPAATPRKSTSVAGWIAAAAALLIALVNGAVTSRSFRAQTESLRDQIRSQDVELSRLKEQVRQSQDAILMARSPGSRVVDLAPRTGDNAAARIFWDPRKGTWKLYTDTLPPAGPGRTYQLWLVTSEAKISAGVFDTAGGDEASGTVTIPASAGPVIAAAITPEPEGGSPQPTGPILLLGKI